MHFQSWILLYIRSDSDECNPQIVENFSDLRQSNTCGEFLTPLIEESFIRKMTPRLESIKGGGGSIKVGTTGTISNLMLRELQSAKCVSRAPITRNKSSLATVSIPSEPSTPRKLKPRTSPSEASSSSSQSKNLKNSSDTVVAHKGKYQNRTSHQIPMLNSDNISMEATPVRQNKPNKKGAYIVEVVDIKCGSQDKAWASPITSRLKKLGFSKLSETIA